MSAAATIMAKKKPGPTDSIPARPKGRPKGDGRITSRYAIVYTPEYKTWMGEFLEHVGEPEVSEAFREGIRRYAEATGFRSPPKR